jgi:exosortase family protein XrtF
VLQTVSKYKPFLLFLAKFFGTYIILTLLYSAYLSHYGSAVSADPFTTSVAFQTEKVLVLFKADAKVVTQQGRPWSRLAYNGKYVARVVEGCNAVSVMILFVAFVVAFAGKGLTTFWFITVGCLLIHLLNILRIALLTVALYHYPQHQHFLHGVLFPTIIYGFVFFLWVLWVNKFSTYGKRT